MSVQSSKGPGLPCSKRHWSPTAVHLVLSFPNRPLKQVVYCGVPSLMLLVDIFCHRCRIICKTYFVCNIEPCYMLSNSDVIFSSRFLISLPLVVLWQPFHLSLTRFHCDWNVTAQSYNAWSPGGKSTQDAFKICQSRSCLQTHLVASGGCKNCFFDLKEKRHIQKRYRKYSSKNRSLILLY